MKNRKFLFALIIILFFTLPNSLAEEIPKIYYSFEDCTIADVSGNGNDGTIFGASCVNSDLPNSMKSFKFNGINSYLSGTDFHFNTLSMGVWVKPTNDSLSAPYRYIISKNGQGSSEKEYGLFLASGMPCWQSWSTEDKLMVNICDSGSLKADSWSYLAVTMDSSSARIYVDGIEKNSGSIAGMLKDITWPLEIGRNANPNSSGTYFNGNLDEVKIYDVALTAEEIKQEYNLKNPSGSCYSGETQCANNFVLSRCVEGIWQNETCDYDLKCVLEGNIAKCVQCGEGEGKCSEDSTTVFNCVENYWQIKETCNLPEACVVSDSEVSCAIPPPICTPLLKRCYNGIVQKCSSDGKIWQDYKSCKSGCELDSRGLAKCIGEGFDFQEIFFFFFGLGSFMGIILIVIETLIIIFWVICLVSIFKSNNPGGWKALWIILVTILSFLGILLYLFIGRKSKSEDDGYKPAYPESAGYSSQVKSPAGQEVETTPKKSTKTKSKEKTKKEEDKVSALEEKNKQSAPAQALLDYVKTARESGMDDVTISKNLLGVGWSQQRIEEAFAYLKNKK